MHCDCNEDDFCKAAEIPVDAYKLYLNYWLDHLNDSRVFHEKVLEAHSIIADAQC